MTIRSLRLAILPAILAPLLCPTQADAQAVFVARKVMGKIKHQVEGQQKTHAGFDVATVLLEVPADRLYGAALERARHNHAVRVVMVDPGARRFEIAQGDRTATLTVVPVNAHVSHLIVSGTAGRHETSTASMVVGAVMRLCHELGKECSLD